MLKAMQGLETMMQRVQDSQARVVLLSDRIAAAEAAGVKQPLISAAKALETKFLLSEACSETAHIDRAWSADTQQCAAFIDEWLKCFL